MKLKTSYLVRPGKRAHFYLSSPTNSKEALAEATQHMIWLNSRLEPKVEWDNESKLHD